MFPFRPKRFLRRLKRRLVWLIGLILNRPAFRLGVVIVFLALLSSWALHLVEQEPPAGRDAEQWPYANYAATIQQVGILLVSGYDAEQPQYVAGYVLTMFCMFLGLGLLAVFTADLAAMLVAMAMAGTGHVAVRSRGHIIIPGWHHTTKALIEQLTTREDQPHRDIVVVDPHGPLGLYFDPDVRFVAGDPTEDEQLKLANASRAYTAIVPIDWNLDEALQDSRTTLTVMAIRGQASPPYICAEVLFPRNCRNVERAGAQEVVCVGDVSRSLLAMAALYHGTAALLSQLLDANAAAHVYRVTCPAALVGQSFRAALRCLLKQRGMITLAAQRQGQLFTNPRGEFLLQAGDGLFVIAREYPDDLHLVRADS